MTAPGESIRIECEADIVAARKRGRDLATHVGLSAIDRTLVATAISEVARNILVYAKRGEIALAVCVVGGRRGLTVVARDAGPGIVDLARALEDGYTTGGGLGLGLPGARRLMDEFDVKSTPGAGTVVTMTKWRLP